MNLSPIDAYALARKLIGEQVQDDLKLSPAARMLVRLESPELKRVAMEAGYINAILAAKPADSPPLDIEPLVYVPPLPSYAMPSDKIAAQAEKVACWLTGFTTWATKRSPLTPPIFLEAGGCYLIALAIARRIVINTHSRIFPHLYLLWVAETTRFAKSTGLSAVQDVAALAMPHMLMPHQSTPERMLESMAGKMPVNYNDLKPRDQVLINMGMRYAAQRGILLDEASSLLGAAKRDYMQGLQEWLLEAYDAPERKVRDTKSGTIIVNQIALNILGATTPAAMARTVTPDKWEDGEMARYALLFPDGPMPYTDDYGDFEPPLEIVAELRQLHEMLPQPRAVAVDAADADPEPVEALCASIAPDAMKAYKSYQRAMKEILEDDPDQRLSGNYGRLPTMALKVALGLASMDWAQDPKRGRAPTITLPHWHRAQTIVESWRASLHRLMPALSESLDSRAQNQIERLLSHSPSGLTKRDISRRIGVPVKYIESAINVLIESGLIECLDYQNPNGGMKTKLYRHNVVVSGK